MPAIKIEGKSIHRDLGSTELRELARKDERTTAYGSASYITRVRNRSARNTYVVGDGISLGVKQQPIADQEACRLIAQVNDFLKDRDIIQVDRTMGQHPGCNFACRLYVTKDFARLAFMWSNLLFPPTGAEPDLVSVYVPEWPERKIIVKPREGITYILGTDYLGEAKKSFLRMAMYRIKEGRGLGFHAGSKIIRVKQGETTSDVGFLLFGLSGTGKTTLTLHNHGLSGDEGVVIRQDDVVFINENGFCYGTENGFYLKTEGLEPSQEVLYTAALQPTSIFENVMVKEDGQFDFDDHSLTSNGRCVVLRSELKDADDHIDLVRAHKLIFITRRNDVVPIVAKLTPEQAAAFFMLGESIETSAGDPSKAGQSKREVGTNPFLIGPEAEEGNRLLKILAANPEMEGYLLNTGHVGASSGKTGEKITVKLSAQIMKHLATGDIAWRKDPDWGYLVPDQIPGVDLERFDPASHYTPAQYSELTEKLRQERRVWLEQFPGLDPKIPASVGLL